MTTKRYKNDHKATQTPQKKCKIMTKRYKVTTKRNKMTTKRLLTPVQRSHWPQTNQEVWRFVWNASNGNAGRQGKKNCRRVLLVAVSRCLPSIRLRGLRLLCGCCLSGMHHTKAYTSVSPQKAFMLSPSVSLITRRSGFTSNIYCLFEFIKHWLHYYFMLQFIPSVVRWRSSIVWLFISVLNLQYETRAV